MTPKGFSQVVAITENTYRVELTEAQRSTWFALLRDADDAVVKTAAVEWCQTQHFAPVPADLLREHASERTAPSVDSTRALLSASVSGREKSAREWWASLSDEEQAKFAAFESFMPALSGAVEGGVNERELTVETT